jgi:arylsulfatase A-like enzyme
MRKSHAFLPWLIPLLFLPGCSREPSRGLPATMVWHKDQGLIRPADGTMNIWEGFRVDDDAFVAGRDVSQFILWRTRARQLPVFIEYSRRGRPAVFSLNVRKKRLLAPTAAFKWVKFDLPLSRGMNFLQFAIKGKDTLRVRRIAIGQRSDKSPRHLRPGESVDLFHFPGRGRLELQGRGRIEIAEQQADGDRLPPRTRTLKSNWFSGKISLPIELDRPGRLSVTAREGDFNICAYDYAPAPVSEPVPAITFKDKPDIYIVLSDALQASHLGTYGYPRNTSPHIDAFARDAMVYENAYTNAVFTRSSVATIFTGLYPDSHKVRLLQTFLPQHLLTLPEYLNAKGYATSIITSTFAISPNFGFTQGVDDFFHLPEKYDTRKDFSIYTQLRDWTETAPAPRFSYLHYIHPHFPKVPPADFPVTFRPGKAKTSLERMARLVWKHKRTGVRPTAEEFQEITDAYDSSIAWVDGEFGKILTQLKRQKRYDESLIIFLSDHGEALGEHGAMGHGSNVFEETTRVPLIVKYPKSLNIRGRVSRLTEFTDIFPTLASLFGQQLTLDGRSLPTAAVDAALDERMVVSRTFNRCPTYGMRWRNWYYLIDLGDNEEQLFQLEIDPRQDVAGRYPQVCGNFKVRFLDWYGRFRDSKDYSGEINLKKLPASEIEEMKTLGYL